MRTMSCRPTRTLGKTFCSVMNFEVMRCSSRGNMPHRNKPFYHLYFGVLCKYIRFLKNELGGRKQPSKGHSPKTAGKHSKHAPAPLSKLEAELDLDFTAISQDIKKSVEYVMKKHMHAYPSPQRTGGSPVKESSAEGFSATASQPQTQARTAPAVQEESPRKEDSTSAASAVSPAVPAGSADKAGKKDKKKHKPKHAHAEPTTEAAAPVPPASVTSVSAPAPTLAPAPVQEAGATGKKGMLSTIGSLFRTNSTSSTTSNSSARGKNKTAAPVPTAPNAVPVAHTKTHASHGHAHGHAHAHGHHHSSLGAIADNEEEGDNAEADDGENSVSRMLREREQWESDINQAEVDFESTTANLNALSDSKVCTFW